LRLHRTHGTFGIAVGTGVALMRTLITLLSVASGAANPTPDDSQLTYLSLTAIVAFAGLTQALTNLVYHR
jgi:hypothetical protein